MWSVTYSDVKQLKRIQDDKLFKLSGDRRQSTLEFNFNYGNILEIIDCSVKELDGAVIYCGSFDNPYQEIIAKLFVCGK